MSLPTTALCIRISIYSIHVGLGSFRFVQSLDSFIPKQSQPHLQSGRILSLSPFHRGRGDGDKVSYRIFDYWALTIFSKQQVTAAMWKIPRRFSLTVSLTFTSEGAYSDGSLLSGVLNWMLTSLLKPYITYYQWFIIWPASVVCRLCVLWSWQITGLVMDLDALFKGRLCCFPKNPLEDIETWSESVDKVLSCKGETLFWLFIYWIVIQ